MNQTQNKLEKNSSLYFFVALLLISVNIFPSILLAQESVPGEVAQITEVPVEVTPTQNSEAHSSSVVIVESAPASDAQLTDVISQESISPQDTSVQENIVSASSIENTFNPHDTTINASTTPNIVPEPVLFEGKSEDITVGEIVIMETESTATATSTSTSHESVPEVIHAQEIVVTEIIDSTVTINAIAQIEEVHETRADKFTIAEAETESKFMFVVDDEVITTKKDLHWNKSTYNKKTVTYLTERPILSTDNTEGTLDISGSCADKYFVVLMYLNKEDYDKNPSSYVFNKAYDCLSGRYQYSLKDLPNTLADGTYYLLIGGQSDVGSWYPITTLVPVSITEQSD